LSKLADPFVGTPGDEWIAATKRRLDVRRLMLFLVALMTTWLLALGGTALAAGPSGSNECALADDDCDGMVDEDPAGDANGDLNDDDDGDGAIDEDPAGDAADDPGENQVTCSDSSQDVGGVFSLHAGASGLEACADDGSALPIDGRAIATTDQGGYVAIDGDNSNPEPSNGYARIDQSGPHCGNLANQDSTAEDQSGNTAADCG
jgi:hypothetical protein